MGIEREGERDDGDRERVVDGKKERERLHIIKP